MPAPPPQLRGAASATMGVIMPDATEGLFPARRACEFFSGVGLMRRGLEAAGWSVVWANDNDPGKNLLYEKQFPADEKGHLCAADVRTIDADAIPTVDLATASFPCTDLSLAGAQRGIRAGAHSSAYFAFTGLLERMRARRPPLVLLENVVGLIQSAGGEDFRMCLETLADLGYAFDALVLDAAHFVPQSRPRLFVVAAQEDVAPRTPLRPDFAASPLRPPRLARFIVDHADLPWRLQDLPTPPARTKALDAVLEPLNDDDPAWWSPERVDYLFNQMSPSHRARLEASLHRSNWTSAPAFRRMRGGKSTAECRFDGLAGCLRTPRGGSARQILVQVGFGRRRARLLTPRECARLMGADGFVFPEGVSTSSFLFAFGDAVCVPAVRWIAERCLNPLADALDAAPALIHPESRAIF